MAFSFKYIFYVRIYSTIKRVAESPIKQGVIWSGSDDGKVYITKDGGGNWEKQAGDSHLDYDTGMLVGEPFLFDVAAVDPTTAYAVGIEGLVKKTIDGHEHQEKHSQLLDFREFRCANVMGNQKPARHKKAGESKSDRVRQALRSVDRE